MALRARRSLRLIQRLTRQVLAQLVSSIALALVLLSQLSALVHMGAIRHERCAEHGELVEVGGAPAAEHLPGLRHGTPSLDTLTAGIARSDDHDHCQLATNPPAPHFPSELRVGAEPSSHVLSGAVGHPTFMALVDERLSFAPKTSPPARA